MLSMHSSETMTNPGFGHRHTQSLAPRPLQQEKQSLHSLHAAQPSLGGFSDRHGQRPTSVAPINTTRAAIGNVNAHDMAISQAAYDANFSPLLPSQLLMGSPFQPGSPATFQSPQYQTFSSFSPPSIGGRHVSMAVGYPPQPTMSPAAYGALTSPTGLGGNTYFPAPTAGFNAMAGAPINAFAHPMQMTPTLVSGTSRTVYLGNIPPDTSAEEILDHVRSGQIESVRLLPDKNCAFISFLDGSSATHFHSDAILKKLAIKGQDIKIGWGKPSSVPTSVGLAVQQSGASRNVYLGNLPEDISEDEIREDLGKFGPIDTVKIVREKAIGFVHFLCIGNAVKAVSQLPQEPKWQAPRRVYYGKDRCAYVSKTQQQNAAQYLGIAPGYAHVLNGADRDLITNALAQQSVAAAAVATTAGGVNNLGNRTVYLGNIHPETTIEEICNVVRGGLLHHIRYIPDKHICFVTFIDPTSAASFYALSNLQGLMIHNRRLKIGWGKHSGALPPAIALAVSGGASRNVYVGNLDEAWTEDRLRQDFQEYGEIELVNTLREKSCAFVNFTNIANAIKAIEAVRGKDEYKRFKVNFGKDRCGNPPRQILNHQQAQQQSQQTQQQQQQQQQQTAGHENGLSSPSPNGLHPNRAQNSISPASSGNNGYNPLQGPTASTIFNSGNNNPLTMYLAASQHSAQFQADQQNQSRSETVISPGSYAAAGYGQPITSQASAQPALSTLSTQQAFYNSPNETRSAGLEPPAQSFGHGSHHSMNLSANAPTGSSSAAYATARVGQHNRTVSLPAFSLQQAQQAQLQQSGASGFGGLGTGLGGFGGASGYGLGVSNEVGLPGWAEEENA